jgi:F1F0 ATPase subunit 2
MNEILILAPALAVGLLLGTFFFGGLWWTVIKGLSSPQPGLWFFGSLLLRTGIVLTGFYFVGREDWRRWLLCLLGFVLGRLAIKFLTRTPDELHQARAAETNYAP